jgi:anhydro-N-acetylmuramic acid kinase
MKPLERLLALCEKPERLVLGLSSGTSADGVDAALVKICGNGLETTVEVVAGKTYDYTEGLRRTALSLGEAPAATICAANFAIGEFFAERALDLIGETGLEPEDVDLIGSHGQTIYHLPRGPSPHGTSSTLQIGEPDVIAEKTRIPVIADFRTRDVAAGGEGAPLVPYVDYLLFRRETGAVALQNIGGIANVTAVTPDIEDLIAFDTGPGNMPLDATVRILSRGSEGFDESGRQALRGRIDENLLQKLMTHPYFEMGPPKSTGRETFGDQWVLKILEGKGNLSVLDVLATLTVFVAKSIHDAYVRYVFPSADVREVLVSGGGVHNHTLMAHLRRFFGPVRVVDLAEHGWDPDLKEAMAFAILANETLFGNPNNVPAATGARWPVVLGKISP